MFLFDKNKCEKFFTYSTRKLNIKGISAQLTKLDITSNLGLGEIDIQPQYVEATEKLQQLDFLQLQICRQINQLDRDNPQREAFREEYIKILMQMFQIAQNPSSVNSNNNHQQKDKSAEAETETIASSPVSSAAVMQPRVEARPPVVAEPAKSSAIKEEVKQLIEEDEVKKALEVLKRSIGLNNTFTLLLSQYATLEKRMIKGLLKNTDIEYKDYVSRLSDFVDTYL